jgi:hypothetical protein
MSKRGRLGNVGMKVRTNIWRMSLTDGTQVKDQLLYKIRILKNTQIQDLPSIFIPKVGSLSRYSTP